MAEAHDLLTTTSWASANIQDTITKSIEPYKDKKSQFIASGPELYIGSKQTMSLALVVHELATNSIKYGALRSPDGKVQIRWNVEVLGGGSQFKFIWQEEGGRPILGPFSVTR